MQPLGSKRPRQRILSKTIYVVPSLEVKTPTRLTKEPLVGVPAWPQPPNTKGMRPWRLLACKRNWNDQTLQQVTQATIDRHLVLVASRMVLTAWYSPTIGWSLSTITDWTYETPVKSLQIYMAMRICHQQERGVPVLLQELQQHKKTRVMMILMIGQLYHLIYQILKKPTYLMLSDRNVHWEIKRNQRQEQECKMLVPRSWILVISKAIINQHQKLNQPRLVWMHKKAVKETLILVLLDFSNRDLDQKTIVGEISEEYQLSSMQIACQMTFQWIMQAQVSVLSSKSYSDKHLVRLDPLRQREMHQILQENKEEWILIPALETWLLASVQIKMRV